MRFWKIVILIVNISWFEYFISAHILSDSHSLFVKDYSEGLLTEQLDSNARLNNGKSSLQSQYSDYSVS